MAKIERGEGNLGKLINDEKLYQDTRNTIENLRAIMARLDRGEGTAGLLLKDDRLYQNVNTLSAELTRLLYDFRQNPRKYLSVKVSLF
jgi:phospholipid/cholesterol/gamma-HCH transport system substrate-binding protein